jgi:hypothetical protein
VRVVPGLGATGKKCGIRGTGEKDTNGIKERKKEAEESRCEFKLLLVEFQRDEAQVIA